jgi:hypothetical protein
MTVTNLLVQRKNHRWRKNDPSQTLREWSHSVQGSWRLIVPSASFYLGEVKFTSLLFTPKEMNRIVARIFLLYCKPPSYSKYIFVLVGCANWVLYVVPLRDSKS